MGSSLILKGGGTVPKTVQETITRSNSFVSGDVVRFDPAAGANGTWYKSQANSAENAEVVGVVLSASNASFEVVYAGYLQLSAFSGVSAPVLFLDPIVPGGLTTNPPSAIGSVVKPVLTRTTTAGGYVVTNYLGTQIGGSSTIAVDEIQPVGTIMPYAGSEIPATWLACDGSSYDISSYPELYDRIRYTSGDRAPIYGYVARITATGWSVAVVGGYIQFKNNTTTWTTNQPVTNQNLIYDTQAEITAQIIAISGQDAIVQILPNYSSGRLTYPNLLFTLTPSDFASFLFNNASSYGARYRLLDSTGKIVHTNNNVSAVSLVAFNTPDLRGRFALGVNPSAIGELEGDATNISAISGIYPLGSEGGEEAHTLTAAEMAAHVHSAGTLVTNTTGDHKHFTITNGGGSNTVSILNNTTNSVRHQAGGLSPETNANYEYHLAQGGTNPEYAPTGLSGAHSHTVSGLVGSTGNNTAHNNMPPYLAVRYIIKAKPYTRAAIIDDIDIPYSQLLITDLRTRNIGGSNADIVFKANRSGDTGLGTEEMRLSGTTGRLTLHENSGTYDVSISGYGQNCLNVSSPLGGTIVLTDSDTTAANQYRNRWISNQDGILLFGRADDSGTSPTTQMQLDYVGDVGIGVAPTSIGANIRTLDVAGSVGGCIRLRGTAANPVGYAEYVTTQEAYAGTLTNHPLLITTNNLERVRINQLGQVTIGGINTTSLLTGTTGGNNVATIGRSSSNSLTIGGAGNDYAGIGFNIEYQSTLGSYKYRGADWASLLVWKQGGFEFLGNSTQGTAAGSLTLTSFMVISNTGNVGIGVAPDTTNRLKVQGKILASDDITAFSDARYKTNVLPIANSLDRVCALNGVLYTDTNGNRKTGLLAQDVQSVLPEAVSADSDGKLALAYGNLAGLIVEALKELTNRVNLLERK